MSYSGEAADQVVRISLNSAEVACKLSGAAAKEIAVMLYAIFKDSKKTKGKTRLSNMLKSGKELKVFAVRDQDLAQFCKAAKEYGVLYCVLKNRDISDGITDLMVKAEDASMINRIYERFQFATVDRASIKTSIVKDLDKERSRDLGEKLVEKIMQNDEEEHTHEGSHTVNPSDARMGKENPSEPSCRNTSVTDDPQNRPSVRQKLKDIQARMINSETKDTVRDTEKVIEHIMPVSKKRNTERER